MNSLSLLEYLTKTEREMLKQRAKVHHFLKKGDGVREIARKMKISSTTVINIKKYLGIKLKYPKLSAGKKGKKARSVWKFG